MRLTINEWHQRFQQQARWTKSLRDYLYERINIRSARTVLEVGCGTGVIQGELNSFPKISLFGLDINPESITFSKNAHTSASLVIGDGQNLPYVAVSFDVCLCHFVLLWVKNPLMILREMARVTNPGGFVVALAEPDYGGRIDFPESLSSIGTWQTKALIEQGANPKIGRELRQLFHEIGLTNVEVGVIGGQWSDENTENADLEWKVIASDLENNPNFNDRSLELQTLDRTARLGHQRILFVPTFYAFGEVRK